MATPEKDLEVRQGKTLTHVLRWGSPRFGYKPITGITQSAPCLITAVGHGIPDGWRVAVVSVKGMTQLNAKKAPPDSDEYHSATVADADHIEQNKVNASEFSPYVSGGFLQYQIPVDLTGFTARMKIKNKVGGAILASTEAGDTPLNTISVVIDPVAFTITVTISATATAAVVGKKGVYDIELVSAGGVVTELLKGRIIVVKEVTTD